MDKTKIVIILAVSVFFLFAVGCGAVSVFSEFSYLEDNFINGDGYTVDGEVVDVYERESPSGSTIRYPVVEFSYKGKDYSIESRTGSKWEYYEIGDRVTVEVNTSNPYNSAVVSSKKFDLLSFLNIALSCTVLVILPTIFLVAVIGGYLRSRKLERVGVVKSAKIIGFKTSREYTSRAGFSIVANYVDDEGGEDFEIVSRFFKFDVRKYFDIGDEVQVKLDPDNPKNNKFLVEKPTE
jgi:hypothetical protein